MTTAPTLQIKPAGMSYERAMEIAIAASRKLARDYRAEGEEDKVKALHDEGLSDPVIADLLKMSVSRVQTLRRGLGLDAHPGKSGPRTSAERLALEAKVREYHAAGMTDLEIGVLIKQGRGWVCDTRRRMGLPVNRQNRSADAA